MNELTKSICEKEIMDMVKGDKIDDRVILIATIADFISSICIEVSPAIVSVLIVKYGVDKFCD